MCIQVANSIRLWDGRLIGSWPTVCVRGMRPLVFGGCGAELHQQGMCVQPGTALQAPKAGWSSPKDKLVVAAGAVDTLGEPC
jgi:hypothetical protein